MPDITLYFAQHGFAIEKSVDPTRPLSEIGKSQTESVARVLKDNAITVSQIFHSGNLRASQTAEIFANTLKLTATSAVEQFSPNDDVKQTAQQLVIDNALYIGHLPHLEKLIAYLICGDENIELVKLSNSAVICLHKTDGISAGNTSGSARINWYLPPVLTTINNPQR